MRRRAFVTGLGCTAIVLHPLAARAQQRAMPVIGYLSTQPVEEADALQAFRQGLKETGYTEGENVIIDYRFADNQIDRTPALTAELVRRRAAVIVAVGGPASVEAAKATKTTPLVFMVGQDPVKLGLVASLNRPGGNATGINFFVAELAPKRLGLLHEFVPTAKRVAVLVNPAETTGLETNLREVLPAARALGLQTEVLNASTSDEINAAFAAIARERPDALFVGSGGFFSARRVQLTHLATRHAIPAIYSGRFFVEAGGLISYATTRTDRFRQAGVYAGRILKGAKPADLPVVQSTKFELVINLQAARMLGLEVPSGLLSIADEVIE